MSFLQTIKWCEFQKSLGLNCFFIDGMLVAKYGLPFGKHYDYIPRFRGIPSTSAFENAVFLRLEPEIEASNTDFIKNLEKAGFRKNNRESQPSKTLILDITKSENCLIGDMGHKTRYNIRLAEKKGVAVEIKNNLDPNDFNVFWELMKKTSKKDGFVCFSDKYYRKLFDIFCVERTDTYIKTVLAKHRGVIIAAAVVMFCDDTATYLHGASDYNHRSLMAPYLVQWSAILEAKKADCKFYDFWGFDEKKWPGVTRFKKGFSGRVVEYVGTWDYVYKPFWYYGYEMGRKLKIKNKN